MTHDPSSFDGLYETILKFTNLRLVGFDLGGTLFDRTPMHVSATLQALGQVSAAQEKLIAQTVRTELQLGSNSGAWLETVLDCLPPRQRPEFGSFVLEKRRLVSDMQASSFLSNQALNLLKSLDNVHLHVAIVSQGAIRDTRDLLERSFTHRGESVPPIKVYGRSSDTDQVDKPSMLTAMIGELDIRQCLYIGDSASDGTAARELGLNFIQFSPFE